MGKWLLLFLLACSAPATELRLRILDASSSLPVEGAHVLAEELAPGRSSNALGELCLRGNGADSLQLRITHVAYECQAISVPPQLLSLEVFLQPALLPNEELRVRVHGPSLDRYIVQLNGDAPSMSQVPVHELAGLPGLTLVQQSEGGPLHLRFRGARADQMRVLLDGVPLNGASGEAVDLRDIAWSSIGQIELLPEGERPGGVLKLSSRASGTQDHTGLVRLRSASFGTHGLLIESSKGKVQLDLDHQQSYGNFPYQDESGAESERLNHESRSTQAGVNWAGPGGWTFNARGGMHKRGLPGPLYQAPTPEASQEARFLRLRGTGRLGQQAKRPVLAFWHQTGTRDYWSPTRQWHPDLQQFVTRVPFDVHALEQKTGLQLSSSDPGITDWWLQLEQHRFKQEDRLRQDPLNGTSIRNRVALSLGRTLRPARLQGFELRLRTGAEALEDRNLDTRRRDLLVQGSLHLEQVFRGDFMNLRSYLALGLARQAPAFMPRFHAEDAFTLGNPDLLPETSQSLRLGLLLDGSGPSSGYQLRFEAWTRQLKDGIVWRRNFRNQYYPANLGLARLNGIEISLKGRWQMFELSSGATVQDARNRESGSVHEGNWIPFEARWSAYGSLSVQKKGSGASLHMKAQDRSFGSESNLDQGGQAGVGIPGWLSLDLLVWKKLALPPLDLRLGLALNNLTDENVELVDGYPLAGRRIQFEVQTKW